MKVPMTITKEGRRYKYVRKYPNYYLYEDIETKTKSCFKEFDLIKKQESRKISNSKWQG